MTPAPVKPWRSPAWIALTALLVGASGAACGRSHDTHAADERPVLEVRTARVSRTGLSDGADVGGVVQARATATLVARIMAPVTEVRVTAGDRVRAGQVLVVLDDRDLLATVRQVRSAASAAEEGVRTAVGERDAARASQTLARASHDRVASLFAKKSATPQEMDEAVAELQAADARLASGEARVAQAEAALASAGAAGDAASTTASFARIVAPFSGLVTEKLVEPGNMAAPGTPLLRLEDTSGFRLEARLDESRVRGIAVGQAAPVRFDVRGSGGTQETMGEVVEIARAVDSGSRAFLVKIGLPALDGLRSGAFGRARLGDSTRTGLTVPRGAVVRRGQLVSVFVVTGDRAALRLINVGAVAPDGLVEVLAGLDPGEAVVVDPPPGLTDGGRVRAAGPSTRSGERR